MSRIRIQDLRTLTGKAIEALPGPTEIKRGRRTISVLVPVKKSVVVPVKKTNLPRLEAALAMAEKLAIGRDPIADDAALAPFGEVDPIDWSDEAVVRALMSKA